MASSIRDNKKFGGGTYREDIVEEDIVGVDIVGVDGVEEDDDVDVGTTKE